MKNRELAIDIFNGLSDEQVIDFIRIFSNHYPNAETIKAIEETENIINDPNRKHYHNFDEIVKEIEDEDNE